MFIPQYGIEHAFKTGPNLIEFTPVQAGPIPYSCWMGMIRGTINVVSGEEDPAAPAAWAAIPTENVAVARLAANRNGGTVQQVEIELTPRGFSPAILVLQAGLDTEWNLLNKAGAADLLVPAYYTRLTLAQGDNPLYLYPTESFEFSTGDNGFYGYVKVVEDLARIDLKAIKAEAAAFKPQVYPPEFFTGGGGGNGAPGCH
jgi:hypothetical protein